MCVILHTESSMGWGGQEIRIVQESLGMIKRGFKILIAAPEQSVIFKKAKGAGIDTFPAYFQKKNPLSIIKILSLINRVKPKIINTHSSSDSWVSTIAAKLSKIKPTIIRTRHLSTPISKSVLSRLIYEVLPDAVITTGEEIRQRMINDNGFDASKIFSIPTGVDLERFNPARVTSALQINGFSVGMIGVLRSWKGHRFFLEAIPEISQQIPNATFFIVGGGSQRAYENIKNIIFQLSLENKVFMLGHRENIPEILTSLDIIVQPSYASEGVPQSILQAMAMGKPVVASDVGAIKEVVFDGKTGFLVKPKNPKLIAESVVALYKNPEMLKEFGKEGRRLIEENYSMEKMLDKIKSLYEKL